MHRRLHFQHALFSLAHKVQSSAVLFVFTKLFLVEVRSVSDSASLGAVESDRLDGLGVFVTDVDTSPPPGVLNGEGEVDSGASLDDVA